MTSQPAQQTIAIHIKALFEVETSCLELSFNIFQES